MSSILSDNIGLHSGTSGIALFMAYYDRIIHNKTDAGTRVIEILEHNIKCIDAQNGISHTICNGISGFGWLCEHLRKLGFVEKDDIAFLDDLDSYLHVKMMDNLRFGNYDYLHGALGVGTYFLDRFEKKEVPTYLNDLLTGLEKSAIPCENGAVKWISIIDHEAGKIGTNISLSHGMSSIAAFLSYLLQMNFETKRVESLLIRTILFILDQITYKEGSLSYFPSFSKESGTGNSRLGWCYGDLGIACVLRRAALVLQNKEWEEMSQGPLYGTSRSFPHNPGLWSWDEGIPYSHRLLLQCGRTQHNLSKHCPSPNGSSL